MWHNSRPHLAVSQLPPGLVDLRPGQPPMAACPECGLWRTLKRKMLTPHRTADGRAWCPGSGQRFRLDLSPGQWRERMDSAARDAETRRGMGLVYRRTRLRYPPAA